MCIYTYTACIYTSCIQMCIYIYIAYMHIYRCVFTFILHILHLHTGCVYTYILHVYINIYCMYGVASVSTIDQIIDLFCKRALLKRRFPAKQTYNLIDPTDRSHPIQTFCARPFWSGRNERLNYVE